MNVSASTIDRFMAEEFQALPGDSSKYEYASANHQDVFAVKLRRQGIRDVRDATLQLAAFLGASQDPIARGFILVSLTRISPARVLNEWLAAKSVFLPEISRKLCLIALIDGQPVWEPHNADLQRAAERFRKFVAQIDERWDPDGQIGLDFRWPTAAPARQLTTSWKHLEVEKLLLHYWLLHRGPIGIGKVAAKVGCSYPTVKEATAGMIRDGIVRTGTSGALEMLKYPRERWTALITAAQQIYTPVEFFDATGEPGAVEALLKRLRVANRWPEGVAMGGVAAGRHWNPDFDLNGAPRVDLVLHVPRRNDHAPPADLKFVRQLDPALTPRRNDFLATPHRMLTAAEKALSQTAAGAAQVQAFHRQLGPAPVLVIHPIHRQDPLFSRSPDQALPWADPVETILHLNLMGLTAQAGELVSRLRSVKIPRNVD